MTLLYMIQALPFISTCPCILHIQSFLGLGKIDVPILQKRKSSLRDIVAWLITKLELEPKTHNSPFRTLESHLNTSATSLPCSGIGWSQQMKVKNCSRQKIHVLRVAMGSWPRPTEGCPGGKTEQEPWSTKKQHEGARSQGGRKAWGLAPRQLWSRARVDFGIHLPGLCSHSIPISRTSSNSFHFFLLLPSPTPTPNSYLTVLKNGEMHDIFKKENCSIDGVGLVFLFIWVPITSPTNYLSFFPFYQLIRMGETL